MGYNAFVARFFFVLCIMHMVLHSFYICIEFNALVDRFCFLFALGIMYVLLDSSSICIKFNAYC